MWKDERSLFPHIFLIVCFAMLVSGFVLGGVYLPQALAHHKTFLQELISPTEADCFFAQVLPMHSYYEASGTAYPKVTVASLVKLCSGVDLRSPLTLLAGQLPAQGSVMTATAEPESFYSESPVPAGPKPIVKPNKKPEQPKKEAPTGKGDGTVLVGIYSTHTSECYATGATGSPGGVYQVGEVLTKALEEKGIGVVHSATVHDSPDWSKSYQNSAVTAAAMLEEYPTIKILIDLHRDANLPKDMVTTEINGAPAVKIMFVVGSDARAKHPHWQQNKAFSEKVAAKMKELYPGLLREVRVQNGRYNQHLLNTAILTEFGADNNTQEEACHSAKLMAEVLAAVLADMT